MEVCAFVELDSVRETSSVHWHQTPGFVGPLPDSLYLTHKPAFFGSQEWPWVDAVGAIKVRTLPAKARYDAGQPNNVETMSPAP